MSEQVASMDVEQRADKGGDEILFPAGTLVKIDGLPFWLASHTVLLGYKANLNLISQERSSGLPSVLSEAQAST